MLPDSLQSACMCEVLLGFVGAIVVPAVIGLSWAAVIFLGVLAQ
jgi:hypothetical protein